MFLSTNLSSLRQGSIILTFGGSFGSDVEVRAEVLVGVRVFYDSVGVSISVAIDSCYKECGYFLRTIFLCHLLLCC